MYMLRQIMNKITLEQKLARSTQTTSLITANEARVKRERQTLTFTHPASIGLLNRLHSDREALGDRP